LADLFPRLFRGSSGIFSERGFEFPEELFDGIQVRQAGRQIEQGGAGQGDGFPNTIDSMAAEVVDDDAVASVQSGAQELLNPRQEELAVHGSFNRHGAGSLMAAQGGDNCLVPAFDGSDRG